jgi:hypothetical protein
VVGCNCDGKQSLNISDSPFSPSGLPVLSGFPSQLGLEGLSGLLGIVNEQNPREYRYGIQPAAFIFTEKIQTRKGQGSYTIFKHCH